MGMILKLVYLFILLLLGISFNANAKCAFNCTNNLGSNEGPANFINKIIKIKTPYIVAEPTLIDSLDVNNDGIEDFVIGMMVEPYAQLGIECCEVPPEMFSKLKKLPAYLIISSENGYRVSIIPNSESYRTWSGKFFENLGTQYFYLGKNGELGLPHTNTGEKSVLYKVIKKEREILFELIWEAKVPTVTSSVSTHKTHNGVYILENNYGDTDIVSIPSKYDTILYKFNNKSTLDGIFLPGRLKKSAANNYIEIIDYNNDGKLDLIAASEVEKSYNGKEIFSKWPESYVVDDFLNNKNKIKLSPASYGNNHSGTAINIINNKNHSVIIEASTEFLGHQGGGFKGAQISGYNIKNNFSKMEINGNFNAKKGGTHYIHDFIFKGKQMLTSGYYSRKPQKITLSDDGKIIISSININNYVKEEYVSILPLKMGDCNAFATIGLYQKSKTLNVKISNCMK